MKRKQLNTQIPKVGIALVTAITIILVVVGTYRDSMGEVCSGFMGTKASCVEEIAVWPFGLIGFTLILFFGAWWTINYMNKSIESSKSKSKK
jgi:hypothetical protein